MGENISVTDALALLGNRNNGGAFGDEGVLLLFIILLFGGWGGRGWGGNQGGGYGAGGVGGNELYPWLNWTPSRWATSQTSSRTLPWPSTTAPPQRA